MCAEAGVVAARASAAAATTDEIFSEVFMTTPLVVLRDVEHAISTIRRNQIPR
jgi:hypothetical protein